MRSKNSHILSFSTENKKLLSRKDLQIGISENNVEISLYISSMKGHWSGFSQYRAHFTIAIDIPTGEVPTAPCVRVITALRMEKMIVQI